MIPTVAMAQQAVDAAASAEPSKRVITFKTAADLDAEAAAKAAEVEARRQAFYDSPLGKTFWYKPSKTTIPVRFYQAVKADSFLRNWRRLEQEIKPEVTVSFKVVERIWLHKPLSGSGDVSYAYRIVFEDGTPAYAEQSHFGIAHPDSLIKTHGYSPTNAPSEAVDEENRRLFTENPELLVKQYVAEQAEKARVAEEQRAAEAQRLAAAKAARASAEAAAQAKAKAKGVAAARDYKRRGGVSLGMTPQQVRASNWGVPQHVNRTTGSFGVHEQWVYGGGNYLYFQNGTLTSIQN